MVVLAQPGAIASGTFVEANTGSDQKLGVVGEDFYIFVHEGRFNFSNQVVSVTGDGDTHPEFASNGMRGGSFSVRGLMVAGQAIGIASLSDTDKATTAVAMRFNLSARRNLVSKVLVHQISVDWSRHSRNVGVTMAGVFTEAVTETADS